MFIDLKLLRSIKGNYVIILTYCVHKRNKCVNDIMLSERNLVKFLYLYYLISQRSSYNPRGSINKPSFKFW